MDDESLAAARPNYLITLGYTSLICRGALFCFESILGRVTWWHIILCSSCIVELTSVYPLEYLPWPRVWFTYPMAKQLLSPPSLPASPSKLTISTFTNPFSHQDGPLSSSPWTATMTKMTAPNRFQMKESFSMAQESIRQDASRLQPYTTTTSSYLPSPIQAI